MITIFFYAAIAIAFLTLVIGVLRKRPNRETDDLEVKTAYTPRFGSGRWLDLSEPIFNPSDARWLEEELAFPKLAGDLRLERKRLAIRWLQALQASFDEIIRTPEIVPSEATADNGWHMLALTLRFKFLVAYALLMVRMFGPYHQLIPSFSWVPAAQREDPNLRRAAMAGSRGSN